ncbi:hypothetical protein [Streptosporangium sp. NPDC023615]|uniref:hypothetical protein n=1 Tax=Streptosporangium sp. NPDC023615 TaxID=3154794 RepID=UPI003444E4CD
MSFELAVWYEPEPITRERARDVFRAARHAAPEGAPARPGEAGIPGERRDGPVGPGDGILGETEGAEPHPGVVAFAGRLPGAEWLSPGVVLVTLVPERADEDSAEVFALAAGCGLVCYDPRRHLVHNLEPRGVHPAMEMRTGDGMIVVGPDLGLVSDALTTLSPQNPFMALVVFGEHFVQTSPEPSGYELEYRDSVRGLMFRTHVADLAAVQDAFVEYATGGRAFMDRHDWRPV